MLTWRYILMGSPALWFHLGIILPPPTFQCHCKLSASLMDSLPPVRKAAPSTQPFFLQVLITPRTCAAISTGMEISNPYPTLLPGLCKKLIILWLCLMFLLRTLWSCPWFFLQGDLLILGLSFQSIHFTVSTATHWTNYIFLSVPLLHSGLLP